MQKTLTTLFFILALTASSYGQQEAQYTQYMFNRLAINPAYAGSHESLSITSLYRNQWAGLEGAPETMTFSAHTPLRNERLGMGILLVNDKVGIHEKLTVSSTFSYSIPISDKERFSFGLQAGFVNQRSQYSDVSTGNTLSNDPSFMSGDFSSISPEFGVGFFYQTDKFYAGISAPKLTATNTSNEVQESNQHFFLNSGYVFEMNDMIKIHPSMLVKMVSNAPVGYDVNATVIFNDVLWTGVSYRSESTFSFLAQIQATPQLRFGYAYDSAPFRNFSQAVGGTHEIMLNYRFSFFKSKVITPRYF